MVLSPDDSRRLFFEAIPCAAFVIDPDAMLLADANDLGCTMLGRERSDAIGMSIGVGGEGGLARTWPEWLARIAARVATERSPCFERVLVEKGGRLVSAEASAALHDTGGDRAVVVTVWDRPRQNRGGVSTPDPATALTRSGKRIDTERENLRVLIDATEHPMMLFDPEGMVVAANAAVSRDTGMKVHEMEGLMLEDLFDKETAAMRHAVTQEVLRTKRDRIFDEIVSQGYYRIHVVPILDGNGDVSGVAMSGMEMTELVAMQREVIEKEQFHTGIIDAIQDGLDVVDTEQRILYANKTFNKWFEHLGPLQGKHHKIIHENLDASYPCPVDMVLKTGQPAQAVRPFSKGGKDGGWLEVFSFPLFGAEGEIRGAVQYCREITEKLRLERHLHMERRRFREYYDFSPVGIATALPSGQWVDVNVEYCSMLGYSKEEVLTMPWEKLVHPEDRPKLVRFHESANAGLHDEFHEDIRYIHRAGNIVHASFSAKYIPDESGNPEYVLAVVQDISARKAAENELHQIRRDLERRVMTRTSQLLESESNLRALLNAPVVSSFLLDEDDVVLSVNDLGAERLGFAPDEVFGRKITEFFPPKLAASRKNYMTQARRSGTIVKFQDQRGDMLFDISIYPISNSNGQVTRLALFAEDITRTHELERQLLQAQKMEALGIMAGGIAHDFNNILGVIITNAELLGMVHLEDKAGRRVSRILDAGVRAREIVKQILTFSRAGLEERQCVEIGGVIVQFAELTRASLPANIEFQVETDDSVPMGVCLDMTQLQQLILNLCVNAEHAMGETGGKLTMRLDGPVPLNERNCLVSFPELSPGQYARLQITDTGKGIPSSIIERIFEPFFTTKPKGVGTGLGLSMVHGIVRRHGGAIRVRSEPGKGAEFTVLFPLCDEEAEQAQSPVQKAQPDTARILFVDDDMEYRTSITQALESMGYEVTEIDNGGAALQLLEAERFGLVLTDQTMPAMSGIEFAERMRAQDITIPVLLCTGYSQYVTEEKLHQLGLGLLMKPFTLQELERAVTRMLYTDKDPAS